jgi:hypothetical protein
MWRLFKDRRKRVNAKYMGNEYGENISYTCENRIMKLIEVVFQKDRRRMRKSNRGGEFDQGVLYACMEISQ